MSSGEPTHVIRGTVRPSEEAQALYPLDKYPCSRCADPKEGLPHLVDNASEFYWEHQHEETGSSARTSCLRFNKSHWYGPRNGTAVAKFYRYG